MKRLAMLALAPLLACSSAESEPATAPSDAAATQLHDANTLVEADPGYVGVLLPKGATDVAPTYSGKIMNVHVQVGQWVDAGAAIATFDPAAAREALAMAQAELRAARGDAAQASAMSRHASRKLQTERELFQQGISAASNVDDAQADRARAGAATSSAAGQIGAAKARVDQLERQLREMRLVAPFSGRVAIVYREAGSQADQAHPVVRLIDTSKTFVRFAVPPPESGSIAIGAHLDVIVDWLPRPLPAKVSKIAPEVDAPTGLVFAEAEVGSGDFDVKPHSPAWVRLRGT